MKYSYTKNKSNNIYIIVISAIILWFFFYKAFYELGVFVKNISNNF